MDRMQAPAGMEPGRRRQPLVADALVMLAGTLCLSLSSSRPPLWMVLSLAALLLLTARRWPLLRWLLCLTLALAWADWRAALALERRLPAALEGADLLVSGQLEELPREDAEGLHFVLRIERAERAGQSIAWRGRVRLAWYEQRPAQLLPCSHWQLLLRLKRPRGNRNPGGFDAERAALEHGIDATGYVRGGPLNGPLARGGWCIDRLRQRLATAIDARLADRHDAALLRAFAIGDTRALEAQDWQVARANGVSHLIAISGFHVGVAAGFGVALARLAYLLWPALGLRLPRRIAQGAGATALALAYGWLAGMALPTLRTVLMIAIVALACSCRRALRGPQTLALALSAIVLFDPLAVLSAGFWLSFAGVVWLMLCLGPGPRGWRGLLHELAAGQLLMTVALLPLTVWFFGQASPLGLLSNLVAVPVVSFLIVPLALLAIFALLLWPPLAGAPLWLAAQVAHGQWWLLSQLATWPGAQARLPLVSPLALLLASVGALWLFLPRGWPWRWLGALLFLPLLWPAGTAPPPGGARVVVLDVGQGLAVLVQTHAHRLLYDAGARLRSGFDFGESVVLPALSALDAVPLDRVIVSHADNDHAGGAAAVVAAFPSAQRLAGEPERMRVPMAPCRAGQQWQWDGVRFEVLHPADGADQGNARSCVLLVSTAGAQLLLTGDLDASAEAVLAGHWHASAPLLLQVPHHGSRSSSSPRLLEAAQPRLAFVSAGWRNRFGHPDGKVVQRYVQRQVPLWNTADSGALAFVLPADAPPRLEWRWREKQQRYWQE